MTASIPRMFSKNAPGRPTLDEANARREILLAVALKEFLDQGFTAANLDAIARTAGVGRATIYRQYGGKEELFRAAVAMRTGRIKTDLWALIDGPRAPEETLRLLIEKIFEEFIGTDLREAARLFVAEASRFPDLCATIWEAEIGDVVAPVSAFLERLKRDGILDIGDSNEASLHLVTLAIGGFRFLLEKAPSTPAERRRWIESVFRVIWSGAKPHDQR